MTIQNDGRQQKVTGRVGTIAIDERVRRKSGGGTATCFERVSTFNDYISLVKLFFSLAICSSVLHLTDYLGGKGLCAFKWSSLSLKKEV